MTREDMTPEAYGDLLDSIMPILLKNGLKATTMDFIASSLKMSKRTLYEIFKSKGDMISETLKTLHKRLAEANNEILKSSGNALEALLRGFLHHRDVMRMVNVDFFRDMDSLYADARKDCDPSKEAYLDIFVRVLETGASQGLFRKDINFMVQCKMVAIQMESLKRMEEIFPPDISLLEVYDSICIGFLRGISTPEGSAKLDALLEELNNELPEDETLRMTPRQPSENTHLTN
ncbi:MAG: TetR/AcrR family transcriptional regulator [Muribaculaceae bacterium]|nr:TetR/AcrR family transcriptional regulator [Muribaculaceae bacterium]